MKSWARAALEMIGDGAAMVTLAGVAGSAPREAGTRMIVGREAVWGTVGGGNLEYLLIDQARRLLAQDAVDVAQQDYPLGPLLAQCCGGRVRVLIERLAEPGWVEAANAAELAGERYTLHASVADGRITRSFEAGWARGGEGVELFDGVGVAGPKEAWSVMVERIAPVSAALVVYGAGHVGQAIVHIAATLPFRLSWLDPRAEMEGLPGLTRCDLVAVAEQAPAGALHLVLTHNHELDYQIVRAILRRGDAWFCGLIGSKTKRARFVSRLQAEGIDTSRLVCPIGSGAIRSKDPACIAVAVSAELLERLEAGAVAEASHLKLA